jgi:hypothetical protein
MPFAMPKARPVARRLRLLPVLLLPAFFLAGCMSTGNALHAVGAPVQPKAEAQDKLEQGTALNVAGAQASPAEEQAKAAAAQIPAAPQIAPSREAGVQEIRAKAAVSSGTPTNVFAVQTGATAGMTKAEQEAARAELEAAAKRNAAIASGADAKAKAAAARKLKLQAQTHYDEALKEIEN